jgi:hypothetical protein
VQNNKKGAGSLVADVSDSLPVLLNIARERQVIKPGRKFWKLKTPYCGEKVKIEDPHF